MSWRQHSEQVFHTVLDFLLPPVCANCRHIGDLICDQCQARFVVLNEAICQRCGRPQKQAVEECQVCRQFPLPLTQIRAPFLYAEPISNLIHQLKYNSMWSLATPLATLMTDSWPNWSQPIDLIMPVPLHPSRQRQRGYNQAMLLAKTVGKQRNILVCGDGLIRKRHTRPQVELGMVERQVNVSDAFEAMPVKIAQHHILLIDDVCTTGSTLSAAAKALIDAGADSVTGYCLARAG